MHELFVARDEPADRGGSGVPRLRASERGEHLLGAQRSDDRVDQPGE